MKTRLLIPFTLLAFLCLSCEEEKNAKIEVWLTDAPGDFQEVNIDLQAVEVHSNETDNEKGWQSLEVTPGIINLLDLTNGREMQLGSLELPGGRISQIRLKLGNNNTIKVNDQLYALSTPSAQQSGLKLKINQVLAEGITYKILLDYDAALSVVRTTSNAYSLKPVVRVLTEAQNGAIKGVVINDFEDPISISAFPEGSQAAVATTATDDAGKFLLRGLPAGTYRIVYDAGDNIARIEKSEVAVQVGVVTELEPVQFP